MESEATFQHVATFYSLIVGLAVANVFSAMGKAATTTARVRWYWMHTSASAMLLLLMAQDWWFLLSWDEIRVSHAILVFLLARAGVLYFAASLLLPEDADNADGIIDLREHMLRMRKRVFCIAGGLSHPGLCRHAFERARADFSTRRTLLSRV